MLNGFLLNKFISNNNQQLKNNQRDIMQNAKDTARQLIDQLPDSATLNDIMYELYVEQKIERGMQDSREGKITPHEEVKKRYQQR